MDSIGVLTLEPWYILDDIPLSKELIYFDKLVYSSESIHATETVCKNMVKSLDMKEDYFAKKMAEIELYSKHGLISDYTSQNFKEDHPIFWQNKQAREIGKAVINFTDEGDTNRETIEDIVYGLLNSYRDIRELKSRIYTVILNQKSSDYYTPIIREKYKGVTQFKSENKSNGISIVLNQFPEINTSLPIEQLLEFKEDSDSKLKLKRLKDWVLEITKSGYSEKEIAQKLEYLLHEYTSQLELHKLKYERSVSEIVICTTLEVLENVATLNFSKAAKTLFELKKKKLDLLEIEQQMLGKEVAYIHQAKTTFG